MVNTLYRVSIYRPVYLTDIFYRAIIFADFFFIRLFLQANIRRNTSYISEFSTFYQLTLLKQNTIFPARLNFEKGKKVPKFWKSNLESARSDNILAVDNNRFVTLFNTDTYWPFNFLIPILIDLSTF